MIYGLMIVIGVALAAYGVVSNRRGSTRFAAATANWTEAVATIEQSSLERMATTTGEGTTTSFRAHVAYRYLAEGVEHRGTRPFLCPRVNFARERQGLTWLAGVPAGATVPVWYDPTRPDDASLELNRPSAALLVILVIVGLGLAALGLVLAMMK